MNAETASSYQSAPASVGRLGSAFLAVLVLVPLLLYSPVRNHDFINYDDDVYKNERVIEGLTADNIVWAFSGSIEMGNWDPRNWLSHMATAHFFGLNPAAHHWVNVLIHLANSALLFLFVWRVIGFLCMASVVG